MIQMGSRRILWTEIKWKSKITNLRWRIRFRENRVLQFLKNNRQKVVLRRLKLKNKILACRASFWKKLNWRKIDISCQPKPSVLLQILRRNLLPRSTIFATLVANLHLLYEPFLSKKHTQCHNNLPNVPSVRIAKILQIKKKKRSMLWKIIKE